MGLTRGLERDIEMSCRGWWEGVDKGKVGKTLNKTLFVSFRVSTLFADESFT